MTPDQIRKSFQFFVHVILPRPSFGSKNLRIWEQFAVLIYSIEVALNVSLQIIRIYC